MKNHSAIVMLAGLLLSLLATTARGQVSFDLEGGAVFPGYNDVRIPGDVGTTISFTTDLKTETAPYVRVRALYSPGSRHTISILVAPLTAEASGVLPNAVRFQDLTFPAGTSVNATYKFNSYRLTYRYDLVKNEEVEFGLGLTGKIRDAAISMSGGGQTSTKTNVGFVPLVNLRLLWHMGGGFGLLLDGDALAAPQGRAEDLLAGVTYAPSPAYTFRMGYRILEGGADNDEVYNFALFHYAAVGVTVTL